MIAANPIDVIFQTREENTGEIIDTYVDKHGITRGSTAQVTLGGTLRIPPAMLRIREKDKEFTLGESLGDSMRWKIEGEGL